MGLFRTTLGHCHSSKLEKNGSMGFQGVPRKCYVFELHRLGVLYLTRARRASQRHTVFKNDFNLLNYELGLNILLLYLDTNILRKSFFSLLSDTFIYLWFRYLFLAKVHKYHVLISTQTSDRQSKGPFQLKYWCM